MNTEKVTSVLYLEIVRLKFSFLSELLLVKIDK
jgi:hypothetical protein